MKLDNFYHGKRILITGHTGFKGSWMSYVLYMLGANVTGIALEPNQKPALFNLLKLDEKIDSRIQDIRDLQALQNVFEEVQPEIVFHLAAQPLVIESYENPVYTYDVNVMGTVNICECVRLSNSVKSFINVTTDKVYHNNETMYKYKEDDRLNGFDPYSNSKSCSELVTSTYINSFFKTKKLAVSTCRAGNVIGGGDFSENRIIPDCVKAAFRKEKIIVRNPNSIRPYQHVLEPVMFYLKLAAMQHGNMELAGNYNIGPKEADCITTAVLTDLFCEFWKEDLAWNAICKDGPHEANFLKLDIAKAYEVLGWSPIWDVKTAVEKTVEWSKKFEQTGDMETITKKQIKQYMELMEHEQ